MGEERGGGGTGKCFGCSCWYCCCCCRRQQQHAEHEVLVNDNGNGIAAVPATVMSTAINGPLVLAVLLFMAAALALLMFGAIGEQIQSGGGRIAFYASLFVAFVSAAVFAHRKVVAATMAPVTAVAALARQTQTPAPSSDATPIVIGDAERQVAHHSAPMLPLHPSTAASMAVSSSVLSSPLPVSPAPPPPPPILLPLPSPGLNSLNRIPLARKPKPDSR